MKPKRFLSLLLCAALIFTMLPVTALAASVASEDFDAFGASVSSSTIFYPLEVNGWRITPFRSETYQDSFLAALSNDGAKTALSAKSDDYALEMNFLESAANTSYVQFKSTGGSFSLKSFAMDGATGVEYRVVGYLSGISVTGSKTFNAPIMQETLVDFSAYMGFQKIDEFRIYQNTDEMSFFLDDIVVGTASIGVGNTFTADGIQYKVLTESVSAGTAEVVANSYNGNITIPSTVTNGSITYTVTGIGSLAFYNRSGLTGVTIPSSVTSIGEQAFYGCSGLASLTIPSSVTSIGTSAFLDCSGLKSVTISDSVTSIGDYVFYNCSGLTAVTIPDGVKSIGKCAFARCSGLKSVMIPDSVTDIGESAFFVCSSLISITIPDSVTSMGKSVFDCCSSLFSVTLSKNITSIGESVFWSCSSLRSVTIPDGVTSIGNNAFFQCSAFTGVTIPGSVTSIGDSAFGGCRKLANAHFEGSPPVVGSSVFIDTASGFKIYYNYGASGWTNPWDVYTTAAVATATFDSQGGSPIASKIVEIGTKVTEPDAPTKRGYAFAGWYKEASFVTQWNFDSDTVTEDMTLYAKWSLFTDTVAPTVLGVSPLGKGASTSGNIAITFSEAMDTASAGTVSLDGGSILLTGGSWSADARTYTVPYSGLSYGKAYTVAISGFRDEAGNTMAAYSTHGFTTMATAIVTVSITGHITGYLDSEINDYMSNHGILDYSSIKALKVAGGEIHKIDRDALYTIGLLGTNGSLKAIDFSETAFTENELPSYVFGQSTAVETIILPNSVTIIQSYAFNNCASLKSINLPSGLTMIEYNAFAGCSSLMDFYTSSATPPTNVYYGTFEGVAKGAVIHVPEGSQSNWDSKDWNPKDKRLFNLFIENTVPEITYAEAIRITPSTATISLSCDKLGSCYYEVVADGAAEPVIDTSGEGKALNDNYGRIIIDFEITGLEAGSYDIYVKAKDLRGNVSESVKIDLEEYVPPVDVIISSHATGKLADEIAAYLSASGIPGRYEKIVNIKVSGGELNDDDWDFFYDYYEMPVKTIDLSGTYSQSIPDETFSYYNMTDISLPAGIESIGDYAFENCVNLIDITILSPTPPTVGTDAFYGLPSTARVHVPTGSAAAYKAVDDGDTTDNLWYGLTVVAPGLVSAGINPVSASFDLGVPRDISTTITWNDATVVESVYGDGSLVEGTEYTINSDKLTIKQEYILGLNPSEGDSIDFDISFDVGANATLMVDIVNGHSITTGSISGTVTDGTAPVYGAVVSLTVTDSVYSDVTKANGSYAIQNIPAGTDYTITARKTGYISGSVSDVTVKAGETTSGINITLSPILQTYTVTFDSQGGSPVPSITSISSGSTISAPRAPARPDYTFRGWYKESACTNAWNFSKDRITGNITLYAGWSANTGDNGGDSSGSGGRGGSNSNSSSGGGTTVVIQPEKRPDQPVIAGFSVTPTIDNNGHATVTISERSVADAIAKALAEAKAQGKTAKGIGIVLNIDLPDTAKSLGVVLPQATLRNLVDAGVKQLEINGVIVSLNLDLEAFKEIQKQSTGDVTISFKPVQNLSAVARNLIGTRPVYDVNITYVKDGKTVSITSLGKGTAALSIPYTRGKNEAVSHLFGVYVDDEGNAARIAGSTYDANSRSVIFSTGHLSVYGVGYQSPSEKFTDISNHWAKESIDYVVGRELFSGTADTTFSPNTAMSRGMLVTILARLAGADVSSYRTSSFTDVKGDSYYLPSVEWAYKKGIISGIGGNQFAPDKAVTREEIAVILQNYAKASGYTLPVTCETVIFRDGSSISSFAKDAVKAMQQAGIMNGKSNGCFDPKATATRAEAAAAIHLYIKLTIDPATAQGWARNDYGQWLYYQGGKTLTGWQTIGGRKFYFNNTGIMQTGWIKSGNAWYYITGSGTAVGWLQIDGKWYYFYADGSLAVSTRIDGYEIGENGVRKEK